MKCKKGCVYLVGAGCGRGDLITVRGLSLLQSCDALVYDDLIAPELLLQAPDDCECIYMGKRKNAHSALQTEICEKLIALAESGKTVVRLKGGDPFVFGRGGEEALAMQRAGIPCEVVPGISSAIAIPSAAGIPVTHRAVSRSFHVITAHSAGTSGALPPMAPLAKLEGTLVFLMGLTRLPDIAAELIREGKEGSTPAAVISGGNAPHPAVVRGTLSDIAERAAEQRVQPPAVIVVGETAALELPVNIGRPLDGIVVGTTGTPAFSNKLSALLREKGATALPMQRSVVKELPWELTEKRLASWAGAWLVFTSANGIHTFFRRFNEAGLDHRMLADVRFAVIGSATGAVLYSYGFRYDLCPAEFTSDALAAALLAAASPEDHIVLLRSRLGSPELRSRLTAERNVEDIAIYDIENDVCTAERTAQWSMKPDYLVFSSKSGVDLFFSAHGVVPPDCTIVCIGEVTAQALLARGVHEYLTAQSITAEGIVRTIEKDVRMRNGQMPDL